jgi:hypothetical protein
MSQFPREVVDQDRMGDDTGATRRNVLTQCPYDGTPVEGEACSGGSLLIVCPACEAEWEWHGAWIRRVREPDREKLTAARAGTSPTRR